MVDIALNFTNFTVDGILRAAFDPYTSILGNFFWGIFFGFIGAGLYANERSITTIATYLILIGIFFSIIFPIPLMYLFGLILGFIITVILYVAFVESRK